MSTTRTLAAALAIAALAVPAAQAQPPDMHASVAQAAAQAQKKQDLRSADARDAAEHPRGPGQPVNAPGATAVDSASLPGPGTGPTPPITSAPVAGPPTWPANPQPITAAPVAAVTDDGDGVDWTTIGLGIAGSLLAICGVGAVLNRRSRRLQRVRVAA